jgi:hypothetical protein
MRVIRSADLISWVLPTIDCVYQVEETFERGNFVLLML